MFGVPFSLAGEIRNCSFWSVLPLINEPQIYGFSVLAAIGGQATLKESVDLNTRMAAETNFMLGQMWRLNAAAGLASGQTGVNWAAEQARQRTFFDFGGDYEGGE